MLACASAHACAGVCVVMCEGLSTFLSLNVELALDSLVSLTAPAWWFPVSVSRAGVTG